MTMFCINDVPLCVLSTSIKSNEIVAVAIGPKEQREKQC